MRPRKIVLVISTSDITLSLRRFQLHTVGYGVLCARGAQSALECMSEDVVVVLGDGTSALPWDELAAKLKAAAPQAVIFMLNYRGGSPCVDVVLNDQQASNANVLDRLRFLARRRTGPRKKPAAPAEEGSGDGQSREAGRREPQFAIAG